ncbi:VOC family protein [Paenibacillus agricola]|uniref:VOC family protein n=1 Tax=Paenibacillus agricola TaxID=2716264 RepID=A0ABX0JJP5_9BACL|nr:VOC family protein [Paenibacillus agricola]NHN35292.1 VOC family protein [Paenibacillus agricola]
MSLKITPYLMMESNTREAIQFYEDALDAKVIHMITYGEMPAPMPFPEELKHLVSHAILQIGESHLMFSDSPGQPVQTGNKVSLSISTNDAEKAKQIFDALQQGGKVVWPLEATAFSPAFGTVLDKFGITFTIVA